MDFKVSMSMKVIERPKLTAASPAELGFRRIDVAETKNDFG